MNDKEILEGNKLIAEFLGFRNLYDPERPEKFPKHYYECLAEDIMFDMGETCTPGEMGFYCSYDWLLPVLENIENIYVFYYAGYKLEDDSFIASIEKMMAATEEGFFIKNQRLCLYTDIKKVYKAVIEFIKWYNENFNSK